MSKDDDWPPDVDSLLLRIRADQAYAMGRNLGALFLGFMEEVEGREPGDPHGHGMRFLMAALIHRDIKKDTEGGHED